MRNRDKVVRAMTAARRSLDVGGWHRPINGATHVIDINDFDSRLADLAWDPHAHRRHGPESWMVRDICAAGPWPWPDGHFDFVCCSHVLEDVRDPVRVVAEMGRVGRAGYIECPTAAFELLAFAPIVPFGRQITVGAAHHRWLVQINSAQSELVFRLKPYDLAATGRCVRYTRWHRVAYEQQASWLFWSGAVTAREEIFDIREWLDRTILPAANRLVTFDPVGRVRDRWRRALGTPAGAQPPQPTHGDGVKYPYY